MNKNTLTKFYPDFTAQERFRLVVEAAARRDEEELHRLRETAPKVDLIGPEIEYTRLSAAAIHFTLLFCCFITGPVERLQESEDWIQAVGSISDSMNGFLSSRSSDPEMLFVAGMIKNVFLEAAALRRMVTAGTVIRAWEAFGIVCREGMRLEPETLVRALYPNLLEALEEVKPLFDYALPNDEEEEQWRAQLARTWSMASGTQLNKSIVEETEE